MSQILRLHLLALCLSVQSAHKIDITVSLNPGECRVPSDITEKALNYARLLGAKVLEVGLKEFSKNHLLGCRIGSGDISPYCRQQGNEATLYDGLHPIAHLVVDKESVTVSIDSKDLNDLMTWETNVSTTITDGFRRYTDENAAVGTTNFVVATNRDFAFSTSMVTPLSYVCIALSKKGSDMDYLRLTIREMKKNGWHNIEDHIDYKIEEASKRLLEKIGVSECKFEKMLRIPGTNKLVLKGSYRGQLIVLCIEEDFKEKKDILDAYRMLIGPKTETLSEMHYVLKLYDNNAGAAYNFCKQNPKIAEKLGLSSIFNSPIEDKPTLETLKDRLQSLAEDFKKELSKENPEDVDSVKAAMVELREAAEALSIEIARGESIAMYGLHDSERMLSECDKAALSARALTIDSVKHLLKGAPPKNFGTLIQWEGAFRKRVDAITGYNEFDLLADLLMSPDPDGGVLGYAPKPGIEDDKLLEAIYRSSIDIDLSGGNNPVLEAIKKLQEAISAYLRAGPEKRFKRLLKWASMSPEEREIMYDQPGPFEDVAKAIEVCKTALMRLNESDIRDINDQYREPLAKIIRAIRGTPPPCFQELYLDFNRRQKLLKAIKDSRPLKLKDHVDACKLLSTEELNSPKFTDSDLINKAEAKCYELADAESEKILGLELANEISECGSAGRALLLAEVKASIMTGSTATILDSIAGDFFEKLQPLNFDYVAMAPATLLQQPDIRNIVLDLSGICVTTPAFDHLNPMNKTLLAKLALIRRDAESFHWDLYKNLCSLIPNPDKAQPKLEEIIRLEEGIIQMEASGTADLEIREKLNAKYELICKMRELLEEELPLSQALHELVYEHSEERLRYSAQTETWSDRLVYYKNALKSLESARTELSKCLQDKALTRDKINDTITQIKSDMSGVHSLRGSEAERAISEIANKLNAESPLDLLEEVRDAYEKIFALLSPLKPLEHKNPSTQKSGVDYQMVQLESPIGINSSFASLEQGSAPTPPKPTLTDKESRNLLDETWKDRRNALVYAAAFMHYCLKLRKEVANKLVNQIPHLHLLRSFVVKYTDTKKMPDLLESLGDNSPEVPQLSGLLNFIRTDRDYNDEWTIKKVLDHFDKELRAYRERPNSKGEFTPLKQLLMSLQRNPDNAFATELLKQVRAEEKKLENLKELGKMAFEAGCFGPVEYEEAESLLLEGLDCLGINQRKDITEIKLKLANELAEGAILKYVGPFDSLDKSNPKKPTPNSVSDILEDFEKSRLLPFRLAAMDTGAGRQIGSFLVGDAADPNLPRQVQDLQEDSSKVRRETRETYLLNVAQLFGSCAADLAEAGFFSDNPDHREIAKIVMRLQPSLKEIEPTPPALDLSKILHPRLLSLYAERYFNELKRAGVNGGLVYDAMSLLVEVRMFTSPLETKGTYEQIRKDLENGLSNARQGARDRLREPLKKFYWGLERIKREKTLFSESELDDITREAEAEKDSQIKKALIYLHGDENQISSEVLSRTKEMTWIETEIWAFWKKYAEKSEGTELKQQLYNMLQRIINNPHRIEYLKALENISTGADVTLLGVDSKYIPDLIKLFQNDLKPILEKLQVFCSNAGSLGERGRVARQAIHAIHRYQDHSCKAPVDQGAQDIYEDKFLETMLNACEAFKYSGAPRDVVKSFKDALQRHWVLRKHGDLTSPAGLQTELSRLLTEFRTLEAWQENYRKLFCGLETQRLNATLQHELKIKYLESHISKLVANKAANIHNPALSTKEEQAFNELKLLPLDKVDCLLQTPETKKTLETFHAMEKGLLSELCGMIKRLDFSIGKIAQKINDLLESTGWDEQKLTPSLGEKGNLEEFKQRQEKELKSFEKQQKDDELSFLILSPTDKFDSLQRLGLNLIDSNGQSFISYHNPNRKADELYGKKQEQKLSNFQSEQSKAIQDHPQVYKKWRDSWNVFAADNLSKSENPIHRATVKMVTFWANQIEGQMQDYVIEWNLRLYKKASDTWKNNLQKIIDDIRDQIASLSGTPGANLSPFQEILDALDLINRSRSQFTGTFADVDTHLRATEGNLTTIKTSLERAYIHSFSMNNFARVLEVNKLVERVEKELHEQLYQMQLASFNIYAAQKKRDALLKMPCNPASYSVTRMRAAAFWHRSPNFKKCSFENLWSNAAYLHEATKAYNQSNPNDKILVFPELEPDPRSILWEFKLWSLRIPKEVMGKFDICQYFEKAIQEVEGFYSNPKGWFGLGATSEVIDGVVCTVDKSTAPMCPGIKQGTMDMLGTLRLLYTKFAPYISSMGIRVIVGTEVQDKTLESIFGFLGSCASLSFRYDTVKGDTNAGESWTFSMSELITTCIQGLGKFYQAFSYLNRSSEFDFVQKWARNFSRGEQARRCMAFKLQPAYPSMAGFCVEGSYFDPEIYASAINDNGKFQSFFTTEEAGEIHRLFELISGSTDRRLDNDIFSPQERENLLSAPAKRSLFLPPQSEKWFSRQFEIAEKWQKLFFSDKSPPMTGPGDLHQSRSGKLELSPSTLEAKKQPKDLNFGKHLEKSSLSGFNLITRFNRQPNTKLALVSPELLGMAYNRTAEVINLLVPLETQIGKFRDLFAGVKKMTMAEYCRISMDDELYQHIDTAANEISVTLDSLRRLLPHNETLQRMQERFIFLLDGDGTTWNPKTRGNIREQLKEILWHPDPISNKNREAIVRAALAYPSSKNRGVTAFEVDPTGQTWLQISWRTAYGQRVANELAKLKAAGIDIVSDKKVTYIPKQSQMQACLSTRGYTFTHYRGDKEPEPIKDSLGRIRTESQNAITGYRKEKKEADDCVVYVRQRLLQPTLFAFKDMQNRLDKLEGPAELDNAFEELAKFTETIQDAMHSLDYQKKLRKKRKPLDFSPATDDPQAAKSMSQIYSKCFKPSVDDNELYVERDESLFGVLHELGTLPISLILRIILDTMSKQPWKLVLPINLNFIRKQPGLHLSNLGADIVENVKRFCDPIGLLVGNVSAYTGPQELRLPDSDLELSDKPAVLLAQLHPFMVNNPNHPATRFIKMGLLFGFPRTVDKEYSLYEWIKLMQRSDEEIPSWSEVESGTSKYARFLNSLRTPAINTHLGNFDNFIQIITSVQNNPPNTAMKKEQRTSPAFHRVLRAIFTVIENSRVHGRGAKAVCEYLHAGWFDSLEPLRVNEQEAEVVGIIESARSTTAPTWGQKIKKIEDEKLERDRNINMRQLERDVYMTERGRLDAIKQADMAALSCLKGPRHPYVLFLSGEFGISPIRADKLAPGTRQGLLLGDAQMIINDILNKSNMQSLRENLPYGTLALLHAYVYLKSDTGSNQYLQNSVAADSAQTLADFQSSLAVHLAKALADDIRNSLTDEKHKALLARLILSLTNPLQVCTEKKDPLSCYSKKGSTLYTPIALGYTQLPVAIVGRILSFLMPKALPVPKVLKFKMPRFPELEFTIEKKSLGTDYFWWIFRATDSLFAQIKCISTDTQDGILITIEDPLAPCHYRMRSVSSNSKDPEVTFEFMAIDHLPFWGPYYYQWEKISAIELPPHITDFFASIGAKAGSLMVTMPKKRWLCFKAPIPASFIASLYGTKDRPVSLITITKSEISREPHIIVPYKKDHASNFFLDKGELYFSCEGPDGRVWIVQKHRLSGGTKLYQTSYKTIATCPILIFIEHSSWQIKVRIGHAGVRIKLNQRVLILGSEYIKELISRVFKALGPVQSEGLEQMIALNLGDIIGDRFFRGGIEQTTNEAIKKGCITIKPTKVGPHYVSFNNGAEIEIYFPKGSLAWYTDMSDLGYKPNEKDDYLEYHFPFSTVILAGKKTSFRRELPGGSQAWPFVQRLLRDLDYDLDRALMPVAPYQQGIFQGGLALGLDLVEIPFAPNSIQRVVNTWGPTIRAAGRGAKVRFTLLITSSSKLIPVSLLGIYSRIGYTRCRDLLEFDRSTEKGGQIVVGASQIAEKRAGNYLDPITKQLLHGCPPEVRRISPLYEGADKEFPEDPEDSLRRTVTTPDSELISLKHTHKGALTLTYQVGELAVRLEKNVGLPDTYVIFLEMGQQVSSPTDVYLGVLKNLPSDTMLIARDASELGVNVDLFPIKKALKELVKIGANGVHYKVVLESDKKTTIIEIDYKNGICTEKGCATSKKKVIESSGKAEMAFEWLELFGLLFLLVMILSLVVLFLHNSASEAPNFLDPENVIKALFSLGNDTNTKFDVVPLCLFNPKLDELFKGEPELQLNIL